MRHSFTRTMEPDRSLRATVGKRCFICRAFLLALCCEVWCYGVHRRARCGKAIQQPAHATTQLFLCFILVNATTSHQGNESFGIASVALTKSFPRPNGIHIVHPMPPPVRGFVITETSGQSCSHHCLACSKAQATKSFDLLALSTRISGLFWNLSRLVALEKDLEQLERIRSCCTCMLEAELGIPSYQCTLRSPELEVLPEYGDRANPPRS